LPDGGGADGGVAAGGTLTRGGSRYDELVHAAISSARSGVAKRRSGIVCVRGTAPNLPPLGA